jgi:HAE1 family hydrophobic/amphiphilic exporter-1
MAFSDVSLRRPIAMGCLLIALAFLGGNAYRKMGLELMPKTDVPYITILTVWPGASPTDIEVDVAKKIEDAVSAVDGLKHVTSTCMENAVQTTLEFELGTDVNVAADDVREKVDQKISDFPEGVEKPVIQKFNVNSLPVITLALEGDLPIPELYDYADRSLRDKLSVIAGVADVSLTGGAEREVHVLLNRDALAAAGLTTLQVEQALREGVKTIPAGRIQERGAEYSVRFDAEYHSVPDIGSLQVAGRDGARRYIRDLGEVRMGTEELRQAVFLDGRPAIGIKVVKKADANTVEVVNKVRKAVGEINRILPGGARLVWVSDEGTYIRASVDSTVGNILQGILLTAGILFLFLYNLRSTFVVAVSMPLTILIALFFMQLLGYTLNTSTLLAIGLSAGILVSNSLVVLESVEGFLRSTGDPWRAAREGTADVAVAVLASAGTNVVVMLPIGLMGSLVGLFFRPFAITSVVVNAVSIFISFTLTPILCALFLKPPSEGGANSLLARAERRWNRGLRGVADRYVALLHRMLHHRVLSLGVLGGVAVLFVHALTLAPGIGFSFAPDVDKGNIYVKLEYPTRQNLESTVRRVGQAERLMKGLPGLRHVLSTVGKVEGLGDSQEGVYLAQIQLALSDKTDREESISRILEEVRRRFRDYPDGVVTASIPGLIGGQSTPVEMEIRGENLDELDRIALSVKRIAAGTPGFVDVDTSVREGKPELLVRPRRAILSDLGIPPLSLGAVLRGNLEGEKTATYKTGSQTYDIRVKLAQEPGRGQVEAFQVPTGTGVPVPLSNFATIESRRSPIKITRSDKMRVCKFYASLTPELPLGTAVTLLKREIGEKRLLPPGYEIRFRGDYERMGEAGAAFAEAGILSILLTYLTLSAIMESFKWSALILTTVPMAVVGVLWALALTGTSISIFVLLGVVMLVGIVVNNAILVVDRMQTIRRGEPGLDPGEAMFRALADSFRAVVMVTMAAVLGMLPLAVASGLGSELTNGIGIASAGGILMSGILALFLVPLLYLVYLKLRHKSGAVE